MTTSETGIANQALSAMGARSTITSLAEDSNEAIQCNLLFDDTRDQLLAMAPWDFARFTRTLTLYKALPGTPENTASTTSTVWLPEWPAPSWLYSYVYPPDCIFMRFIVPQFSNSFTFLWSPGPNFAASAPASFPMRFVRATDLDSQDNTMMVLLTNAPQALGTYTRRVTNPSVWSQPFVQALVAALAAKLAIPLAGDKDLMKTNYTVANALVEVARQADGNEGLTIQESTPDWIAIRDGGYASYPFNDFAGPLTYPSLFAVS